MCIRDSTNAFWVAPWLGFGPGNFGAHMTNTYVGAPHDGWGIVNNEYLEILVEVGLLGFTAFLVAIIIWLCRMQKAMIQAANQPLLHNLLIGSSGMLFGLALQYMTFSTLYIMHIWYGLGLGLAMSNLVLKRIDEN